MMARRKPGVYNTYIARGRTWNPPVTLIVSSTGLPKDLTGCSAYVKAVVGTDWTATPLFELSSATGGITITPESGRIVPKLSETTTRAMARCKGHWLLDVRFADGEPKPILEGTFETSESVR
jgi:hypothetical protein